MADRCLEIDSDPRIHLQILSPAFEFAEANILRFQVLRTSSFQCWWTFLSFQLLGSRRGDDQCERCNFGYRLSSSFTCEAYPCSTGGNSSCKTCKDQTARGNDNQCSACNAGYELKDSMCRAYVCNPGAGEACKTCKPLALRTQDEARGRCVQVSYQRHSSMEVS